MRPVIGANYHAPWSHSRASDGAFSWFRAEMGEDEFVLQQALLNKRVSSHTLTRLAGWAVLAVVVCAVVASCMPLPSAA